MTQKEALLLVSKKLNDPLFDAMLTVKSKAEQAKAKATFLSVRGADMWAKVKKMAQEVIKLDFYTVEDKTEDKRYYIGVTGSMGALTWVQNHLNLSNEIVYSQGYKKKEN